MASSNGKRNPSLAQSTIEDLEENLSCPDCRSCALSCPNGFDVAGKVQDIIRLRAVPREFLA